jgi:hypothetical protein
MVSTEMLNSLHTLSRADKLYIMQVLISELAQEETNLIKIVGKFEPVQLVFAWTKATNVPLLLGQVNFFMEFDVCFHRSQLYFEINPKQKVVE